jgi:hypothetical protein
VEKEIKKTTYLGSDLYKNLKFYNRRIYAINQGARVAAVTPN